MIKITTNTAPASKRIAKRDDAAAETERKAKEAKRSADRRSAAKAAKNVMPEAQKLADQRGPRNDLHAGGGMMQENLKPAGISPGLARLRASKNAEAMRASAIAEAKAGIDEADARHAVAAPGNPSEDVKGDRCGLATSRADALIAARRRFGPDAEAGKDFTVYKTALGEWFWAAPDKDPRKRTASGALSVAIEADKVSRKASKAKSASSAPATKSKASPDGAPLPKPGTNAEIIYNHLTRKEGTTKAEVEAALKVKNKADVPCGIRSDSKLFGERFGFAVSEGKDKDGSARFWLKEKA